jgi:two-component system, OmpR family, response regulator
MKKKSILIVENLESERSDLVELLTALGYKTFEASSSDEALKSFSEFQQDLLIVEVLIPGVGGLTVARMVKNQAPDWVKVIITSKIPQSRTIRDNATKKYKADEFFQKPFELSALAKAVEALIGPGVKESVGADEGTIQKEPLAPPPPIPKSKTKVIVEKARKPSAKPPRLVAAETSPPHPPAPPVNPAPDDFSDQGDFSPTELTAILTKLFSESFTGAFQIEGSRGAKQIFFIEGTPVFVQSNIREESLGRLLLADGRISDEDYRNLVEESAETGKKIGFLLVEKNLIGSQSLTKYLCEQTAVKIASAFAWQSGKYQLDRETTYPLNVSTFEAQPSKVILLAYQKYFPIELIEKEFQRHKSSRPRPTDNSLYGNAYEMLTHRERSFLESLKQHALGDAVAQSEIGMLNALRLAYAFIAMGLLSFDGQANNLKSTRNNATRPNPEIVAAQEPAIYNLINKMASQLEDMNHFDLLGVNVDADEKEIEKSYLYAKDAHSPGKLQPGAPNAIRRRANLIAERLDEAKRVLCNPAARRRYLTRLVKMKTDEDDPRATARKKKMSAELAYQRGLLNSEKKQYALAAESFNRAAQADPSVPEYRAKAGYCLFLMISNREQTIKEATNLILGAIKDDRDNVEYLSWLAELYQEEGETQLALRINRQILEKNPGNEMARRQIHYLTQSLEKDEKKTSKSLFGRFK